MLSALKNSTLLNNKHTLLICLFVLTAGASAGSFFETAINNSDKQFLSGALLDHLSSSSSALIPILLINSAFLIMIYFAGITVYGFPFALLILFSKSFSTGFCILLLLYNIDKIGIIPFLITVFIPCIILSAVYLTATTASVNYAFPRLHTGTARTDNKGSYFILFAALMFLTILASALQST